MASNNYIYRYTFLNNKIEIIEFTYEKIKDMENSFLINDEHNPYNKYNQFIFRGELDKVTQNCIMWSLEKNKKDYFIDQLIEFKNNYINDLQMKMDVYLQEIEVLKNDK